MQLAAQRLKEQQAEDEAREKWEAEQRALIAKEEAEEAAKEQAEKERLEAKTKAKQERKERLKAEGKWLTAAQRKQQAANDARRRELIAQGIDVDAIRAAETDAPKGAAKYGKKKKNMGAKKEEEEEVEEEVDDDESEEQSESEVSDIEFSSDDEDDWENVDLEKAKKKKEWEEMSREEKKAYKAKLAAEAEEDEEETSEEESSEEEPDWLRSPVCCIMGHVDTGKTKLLDKIRNTNVQGGEAGGITQQIGATFFPEEALHRQCIKVKEGYEVEVPGMLIIDTPGHESFNNLRMRGSSLADIAILVVDVMHGLEPQTIESLNMLRKRRCPFIIALNKVDRLYQWKETEWNCIKDSFANQADFVHSEFDAKWSAIKLDLAERGINTDLYYEKGFNPRSTIPVVPTSAMTGEGVPDLLYVILNICQKMLPAQLTFTNELQCTVLEVKSIEGLGTTIDVILLNGHLKRGDWIVVCGSSGVITVQIRELLTPQPMKEMRVKGEYVHHDQLSGAMGIKISAPGLQNALAGTSLFVYDEEEDDIEELEEEVHFFHFLLFLFLIFQY